MGFNFAKEERLGKGYYWRFPRWNVFKIEYAEGALNVRVGNLYSWNPRYRLGCSCSANVGYPSRRRLLVYPALPIYETRKGKKNYHETDNALIEIRGKRSTRMTKTGACFCSIWGKFANEPVGWFMLLLSWPIIFYVELNINMIPHQGKGVKLERIFGFVFRDVREIGPKIPLIPKNRLFLVPPGNYMLEGTGKINPGFSSH